jgi:hypothetical protein
MITNKNRTMIAPAYTSTWMIAINCERSIRYITDIQKKFITRNNALDIGLRLVTIIIAEITASIANDNVNIFSKFHCILVN